MSLSDSEGSVCPENQLRHEETVVREVNKCLFTAVQQTGLLIKSVEEKSQMIFPQKDYNSEGRGELGDLRGFPLL